MSVLVIAISKFIKFIEVLILIRCLMSWLPLDKNSKIVDFIYSITEPIMAPCRDLLNRFANTGPIDFSPILALFLVNIIGNVVISILR